LVAHDRATLGLFVAAGIYRDQFQGALLSVLGVWRQHQLLAVQRGLLEEIDNGRPPSPCGRDISDGGIELTNVSFAYSGFDKLVLRDVNLAISAGEMVVLTGASGQGKTTLIKLMSGLFAPVSGSAWIDGQPAEAVTGGLALVLQGDRLIHGSI